MEHITNSTLQCVMTTCHTIIMNISDDEDSEEEIMELLLDTVHRRIRTPKNVPNRVPNFIEHTIKNSSAREFQAHFRMSREAYEWLCKSISCYLQSSRNSGRQTLDIEKQILSVLWILATPDSYRSIGSRFNMGKSSLFACFIRVIRALNILASQLISWPTREKMNTVKQGFAAFAGLQNVIGAIDGTYVPIKAPVENAEVYINRKCFHGITLQAICDNRMKFTDCFTGYPSSVSDIRIFRNSDIYQKFCTNPERYFNENSCIIGDKAYPIKKWCIPPYIDRGNLTRRQKDFNTVHAKTRQVIERSFALLFGRFRRLKYLDMNRTDLIPPTIIACCTLHNICLNHVDDLQEMYIEEGHQFVVDDICEINTECDTHEGQIIRNLITENL